MIIIILGSSLLLVPRPLRIFVILATIAHVHGLVTCERVPAIVLTMCCVPTFAPRHYPVVGPLS